MIPFETPSIYSGGEEDDEIFDELEKLIRSGEVSRAIGWAIGVGEHLACCREEVMTLKGALRGETMGGRSLQNWGLLLYFVKQVRIHQCSCTNSFPDNCIIVSYSLYGVYLGPEVCW